MSVRTQKSFTSGPVFMPMLCFVLPIMLTNILQTLYNIADNVIVGRFSGDPLALAAVGSTGSLSTLFLNLAVGLSAGASVVISHAFGARNHQRVSDGVHTALTFGLLFGVGLGTVAFVFAEDMLVLIGTKPELLSSATLYLRIIFAAFPATSVYNFAAAALRAVGDSRTSLYILSLSGLLNVGLNLVFVLGFGMSVDGVALATAISKYVSAAAVVAALALRRGTPYSLHVKKLVISTPMLKRMLRFGVPNAVQNSMFSISNVLMTGAVNTLETHALSARTIAMNLTNLVNNVSASYTNAAMTFAGQNYGAREYGRIKRTVGVGLMQSVAITLAVGITCLLFVEPISAFYIAVGDPAAETIIKYAREVCSVTLPFYFICSSMNILSGTLRGVGYSVYPMLISVLGICGLRTVWIFTAFRTPAFHSLTGLYIAWPISWVLVISGLVTVLAVVWRKMKNATQGAVK